MNSLLCGSVLWMTIQCVQLQSLCKICRPRLCTVQIDLSKMTDKLANEQMVEQRVLNEVNIHCDKGLRHPSIVRVCVLSEWKCSWSELSKLMCTAL